MSAPLFDTLDNLRKNLAIRLGFGAQAEVITLQIPILDSFLQTAQQHLWRIVAWRHLQKVHIENLGVDQKVLDLPDDADQASIKRVWVKMGDFWRRIEAVNPTHGNADLNGYPLNGYPTRYELLAHEQGLMQLHFYPVPNDVVTIKIEYTAKPSRFTAGSDRASLPDDLIFLHALVSAKAHYRQPDLQAVNGQYEQSLRYAKEANFGVDDSRGFDSKTDVYDAYNYI